MVWLNTYLGPDCCSATNFCQVTSEVPWYKQEPTPSPQYVQPNLLMACEKGGKEDGGAKGGFQSLKCPCKRAALFTGVSLSRDCGILPFSSDGFHFTALKEINKLRVMLF